MILDHCVVTNHAFIFASFANALHLSQQHAICAKDFTSSYVRKVTQHVNITSKEPEKHLQGGSPKAYPGKVARTSFVFGSTGLRW